MSHNINNVIMTVSDCGSKRYFWMTCAEGTNPPISLELHSNPQIHWVILLLPLLRGCRECPLNAESCHRWHGDAKGSEKANLPSLQWGAWCPFHLCQRCPRHHTSGVWNKSFSERVHCESPLPVIDCCLCIRVCDTRRKKWGVCVCEDAGKSALKLLSESPNNT